MMMMMLMLMMVMVMVMMMIFEDVSCYMSFFLLISYTMIYGDISLYVAPALFGYTVTLPRFRFDVFGAALPTLFGVWWVPRAQVERRQKAMEKCWIFR